ncbi:hypothetical protein HN51_042819 [Arachis hypogaea]|uniref:Transmembrane protein n=1 Tax=Arachis hypogaea TaxID=3818 RepID=A0A444Y868_ARAHY|nr:uncharacterized protein LOC107614477 [Arachis ipaensis]XP_025671119.1 uncharacterized protein LOC112770865 [Arachis hypogaea]QHN94972.1 uncharacterized protein DS421_18g605670 [Arachis hypogaea]RYQ98151.1 hypothetical protein Ahy_B08g094218 isoform B [Arachis hypogaea]
MATSSSQIACLLSSSFHSNSYLFLPTRTRSLPLSLTPVSHNLIQTKRFIIFHDPPILISHRSSRVRPTTLSAGAEDIVPSDSTAVDAAKELVSSNDDGVSTVISALLFIAFIGLSILTIGVIYLAVTDFLQKREKDKFEKEEAANKSGKKKKKKVVRSRAGPRGFGQKIDEDEDDD